MWTEWPGLKGRRTQPRARWRSHRRSGFTQTPPFPESLRANGAREGVCRAKGDHARGSPIRPLSCAPSERGLGRIGALSPKPRACSFLAAPWADSCGPLGHQTSLLPSRATPISPRGSVLKNHPTTGESVGAWNWGNVDVAEVSPAASGAWSPPPAEVAEFAEVSPAAGTADNAPRQG